MSYDRFLALGVVLDISATLLFCLLPAGRKADGTRGRRFAPHPLPVTLATVVLVGAAAIALTLLTSHHPHHRAISALLFPLVMAAGSAIGWNPTTAWPRWRRAAAAAVVIDSLVLAAFTIYIASPNEHRPFALLALTVAAVLLSAVTMIVILLIRRASHDPTASPFPS